MFFNNFHFIRPYWLIALIPVFICLLILAKKISTQTNWQNVCDEHLLKYLLINSNKKNTSRALYLVAIGFTLLFIALAGPTWSKLPIPLYQPKAGTIIVFDQSNKMLAKDISPDRNTLAKYKILDLLHSYDKGQVGLVVFAKEAYVVSPLTSDANTIASMVQELNPAIMPVQGENISEGIKKAIQLLKQAHNINGTILLLTASNPTAQDFAAAREAKSLGYVVSIISVGNENNLNNNEKLPITALQHLAKEGGGAYANYSIDDSDLRMCLTTVNKTTINTNQRAQGADWRDEGRWFILALLPLVLLAFRRGWDEELLK